MGEISFEIITQGTIDDEVPNVGGDRSDTYRIEVTAIKLSKGAVDARLEAYGTAARQLSKSTQQKRQNDFKKRILKWLYGDTQIHDWSYTIDGTGLSDVMVVTRTWRVD